jgi:hypothetical protein
MAYNIFCRDSTLAKINHYYVKENWNSWKRNKGAMGKAAVRIEKNKISDDRAVRAARTK